MQIGDPIAIYCIGPKNRYDHLSLYVRSHNMLIFVGDELWNNAEAGGHGGIAAVVTEHKTSL